jgi:hypothetical protein
MVGRATRAGRDPRRVVAGEAGDAVDTPGLKSLGEGHRRQDGGEPPGQHRRARSRGAEQEQMMVTTPASPSASRGHLDMTAANMAPPCAAVGQVSVYFPATGLVCGPESSAPIKISAAYHTRRS